MARAEGWQTAQRQGYWALDESIDGQSPEFAGGEPLILAGDASIYSATDDCNLNPDCTPVTYPMVGAGDLLLDGDGDYATTRTPVEPSKDGFSFSAHVRIDQDRATHDMTVMSQPGEHANLFTLRYVAASRTWEAVVAHKDAAGAETTRVSARAWQANTSNDQFVAVVYDDSANELRLYVTYAAVAATADATGMHAWTPTGDLQVGRTLAESGETGYLTGEIDEVYVFAGVLSESELNVLAAGGVLI